MMRLFAIVGSTASGKTKLGVQLAHHLGSEIVSVDARQVYRGLDLGSGKDRDLYRRVSPPIQAHLIDVARPEEVYTLFDYQRDVYQLLAQCARRPPFNRNTPLVLVGGSGLYLEAVLKRYRIADVAPDPDLRRRCAPLSSVTLLAQLQATDAELARRTDTSSKRRLIRALEIAGAAQTGPVRYSAQPTVDFEAQVVVVNIDRTRLHRQIEQRLFQRLEAGLVAEVERLVQDGLSFARLHQLGLEYREVGSYLAGKKSYQQMTADLAAGIRSLAKRQQTWFRGMARRGIPTRQVNADDIGDLLAAVDSAPRLCWRPASPER